MMVVVLAPCLMPLEVSDLEASTQSFSICDVLLHTESSGLGGFQLASYTEGPA